jgi:hypothetical protein
MVKVVVRNKSHCFLSWDSDFSVYLFGFSHNLVALFEQLGVIIPLICDLC